MLSEIRAPSDYAKVARTRKQRNWLLSTTDQAAPMATMMRFRMLDNCSAVIREGVGWTRRSDTLVT